MCRRHHRGERGGSGKLRQHREDDRRARHPDAFLAAMNRVCDGMRRKAVWSRCVTDLHQREAFLGERLARGGIRETEERHLCADVYRQFRPHVFVCLRVNRGSCRSIEASRFQEYGRGCNTPEREQAKPTCGIRLPVALTDVLSSVMLRPAETETTLAP